MSGIYFPTVLQRLGIADAMRGKTVIPQTPTPIGEVVARGDAELGVQQISELMPVAGIDIVGPLPEELQRVTVFSAGLMATAKEALAVDKHKLPFLIVRGRMGGSAMTAAAVNALARAGI